MNAGPNFKFLPIGLIICWALASCSSSKRAYDPAAKYAPTTLQADYKIFRGVLESAHPGLYWYTPKDSMDYFFDEGYAALKDSMTEEQFKTRLSYVIARIDCGHTSMKSSKAASKYIDTVTGKLFPFVIKFWNDSMVIAASLRHHDPVFGRGTVLESINGMNQRQLTDTLFNYITTDGYSLSGKYQALSSGFTFASLYKSVIGFRDTVDIHYRDSLGQVQEAEVPLYDFRKDTLRKQMQARQNRTPKLVYFSSVNLQLDTTMKTAFMTVTTFDHHNHLRKFFKKSFKELKRDRISDLVIDVRSNGGGDAGLSTLLTRYLIDHKFKLADSLYTIKAPGKYDKYIANDFWYNMLRHFMTRKEKDGKYHFHYFEKHYFSPKDKNHFNGNVYLLIGGNSFSATTLFVGALKGQKNITVVGEETGGGYYGNSAWIIQDVTLPNTGVRFRLPRFRMVIDKNRVKDGRGVMPDVWSGPSSAAIREGIDYKALTVKELIDQRKSVKN
ncbi:MAG TPA: S41 family peptidase [Puia sp.]|nr:S41 family peptidase [Puia sp.]